MSEVERLRLYVETYMDSGHTPTAKAWDARVKALDALLAAVREEQSDTIAREVRANIPHDAHPDYAEGMRDAAAIAEDS